MSALTADAPAKINRELRVGGRRPDGFHELLSRFSSIDLADTITVEAADRLELSTTGRAISGTGENLVLAAARALAEALGIEPQARIHLEKRIPVGAGLGGGSSDAARTLRLLGALWAPDFPEVRLAQLALALGSDVPYFLIGGEADVSGRGEHITARPDARETELLLLVPSFPISTRDAFAAYGRVSSGRATLPPKLDIDASDKFFGPNELASPVLGIEVAMKAYLESAEEIALESAMTGSGSTVVLFGAKPGAEHLLAQRHPEAEILRARTLGRREYERRTSPPGGSQWTSRR